MKKAVFILSTGRCGTQWIAAQFARAFGDRYWVEHEPLHHAYLPRRMIAADSLEVLPADSAQQVREHVAEIERRLETMNYLECGHPCWGALPFLARHFKDRLRVIHLTRHPLLTALSWLTHGAYQQPFLPHLREKVLVSPEDPGLAFPEYRARWAGMTAYEKCLYYWLEVNALGAGARYAQRIGAPKLTISYERLFDGTSLHALLEFLELPQDENLVAALAQRVDQFQSITVERPAPELIRQHPHVLELAEKLGYDGLARLERPQLRRYLGI